MELRHFRYFAAVAQHLGFSEASRRLRVAQPAISKTVHDLEGELEVKLFLRDKHGVHLTAAGAIFLGEVQEILRHSDEAKRLSRRAAKGEVGTLRIAFLGPAMGKLLPSVMENYRSRYPDVDVKLNHLNPDQQWAALDEGRVDLTFNRPLPKKLRSRFAERPIYFDFLGLAIPANHPLAKQKRVQLGKCAEEAFVQFYRTGSPAFFDQVTSTCRKAGFSPHIVQEPDLMTTVLTLVESGVGVSLVPGCVRTLGLTHAVVLPLGGPAIPIPLCAAWNPREDNPAREAFLEVVRDLQSDIRRQMK